RKPRRLPDARSHLRVSADTAAKRTLARPSAGPVADLALLRQVQLLAADVVWTRRDRVARSVRPIPRRRFDPGQKHRRAVLASHASTTSTHLLHRDCPGTPVAAKLRFVGRHLRPRMANLVSDTAQLDSCGLCSRRPPCLALVASQGTPV